MIRFLAGLLFTSFIFSSLPALAEIETEEKCGRVEGLNWTACIYSPKNSDRAGDFLYVFHQAGLNEKFWRYFGPIVNEQWGEKRIPTVIVISWGRAWLLTQPNGSAESGLLKQFADEVIPAIEKVAGRSPGRRLLAGISMGGYNATQLLLQYPKLFSRAALICPGFIDFNPYASPKKIADYVTRTGADRGSIDSLLGLIQSYYPNAKAWDADSPLLTASKYLSKESPAILINASRTDPYGFYQGATDFAAIAQARGAQVQFLENSSTHCQTFPLADFVTFFDR